MIYDADNSGTGSTTCGHCDLGPACCSYCSETAATQYELVVTSGVSPDDDVILEDFEPGDVVFVIYIWPIQKKSFYFRAEYDQCAVWFSGIPPPLVCSAYALNNL